jgi:pimeloyl-ACP methyl ester carboxylesterase
MACFYGQKAYVCSRFTVPLDYSIPAGKEASIASIKLPTTPTSPNQYKGILLMNPGGPAESGVDFVRNYGPSYLQNLELPYDLVGWDSRGVGLTTPSANCFEVITSAQLFKYALYQYIGLPGDTNSSLFSQWAMLKNLSSICSSTISEAGEAGQHMTSAVTATDVLSIIDTNQALLERQGHAKAGKALLNYWG